MDGIESLLGKSYRDLKSSDALRGLDIPERKHCDDDRSYVDIVPGGISLMFPGHETVGVVFLHAPGHEGFAGYGQPLPGGLTFGMGRSDVRSKLGEPDRQGEEGQVFGLGRKGAWDSFLVGSIRLHIEYVLGGGAIQLVTIMAK